MRTCPSRLCLLAFFLSTAAFAQTTPTPAPAPQPAAFPTGATTALGEQIAAITSSPGVIRAHWGIAVTALDGTPIFGFNEGEFFRPASNNKLFTTAAAMHLFGPSSHVLTTVIIPESIDSHGTVNGDVKLDGAGDANLSGRTFPYRSPSERRRAATAATAQGLPPAPPANPLRYLDELAAEVANKGVKHITGDILGDDSAWPWEPYANDWSIDDALWGYGAPVSALSITDNQLELTITPSDHLDKPATFALVPDTGYYQIQNAVTTVAPHSHANVRIDRDLGSRIVYLRGTVSIGEPYSTEIAIEDPAEFAAHAFKTALEAQGIKVDGKALAHHRPSVDMQGFSSESRTPIPTLPRAAQTVEQAAVRPNNPNSTPMWLHHTSPSLADDVTLTLKISQNLHAELLLHRLGAAFGTDGSAAQGVRVVRQFLLNAGLDADDFAFYDGSGLSGHDLVTPRATAKLLTYATQQPWFPQWKAALPIGGEDGTLSSRFPGPPLKDHLFAKTGTLSEARALSGYLDCASGKTVIFSMMVDTHAPNTSADREAMDSIVAAIAAAN